MRGAVWGATLFFVLGVLLGAHVPYVFGLVRMVLRHCGGM